MAATDPYSRGIGGNQRERDAATGFSAQQMFRIVQLECQPQQRGGGGQRDVTFFPGDAYAQHILLPVKIPVAHHAEIGDRTRIGTRKRPGERETRDFQTFGQTVQILFFLSGRAVMQQQFCRTQRVGNHHRHRRRTAA